MIPETPAPKGLPTNLQKSPMTFRLTANSCYTQGEEREKRETMTDLHFTPKHSLPHPA